MHTTERRYRLIHLDRRTWTCASLTEAMRIITHTNYAVNGWYLPEYLKGLGERPFTRFPEFIALRDDMERSRNYHRWIILDETGLIMPRWLVDAELQREGFRFSKSPRDFKRKGNWRKYRGHYIRYTGKRGGRYRDRYRYPKTMQERREQERIAAEMREHDIVVRPRRYLPSAWDDISRNREKNWKRHRQTQYRER